MTYCGICGEREHAIVVYADVEIRACPYVPEGWIVSDVLLGDDPAKSLRYREKFAEQRHQLEERRVAQICRRLHVDNLPPMP